MLIGAAGMGICLFALGMAAYLQKAEIWVLYSFWAISPVSPYPSVL